MSAGDPRGSRVAAAAALRELAHALVGHEGDPAVLDRLARWATEQTEALRSGATRARPDDALVEEIVRRPAPVDGEAIEHYADCPVSGSDNPFSLPASARRQGHEVVVDVTLGRAHEGAPGRAHGGVVAALFDDAFGFLSALGNEATYGGRLEVTYLGPTPLDQPLEARCRFTGRQGRRLCAEGELVDRGRVVAKAQAVLVTVPQESVGRATYQSEPEAGAALGVTRTSSRR